MTSLATAAAASTTRLRWRAVADAWRGITGTEIIAALLVGSAYFVYDVVLFFHFVLETDSPIFFIVTFLLRNQTYAFTLMLAVVVADRVTARDGRWRDPYVLAVVVSAAVAAPLGLLFISVGFPPDPHALQPVGKLAYGFFVLVILNGAATFVYVDRRRSRAAQARLHVAQIERARAARRTLESRLQAMQARVEPQFLLNTLAQVHKLYRLHARLAERMLDELIAYLRAAMPKMRDTSSTLAQEIELARAYLEIVRIRLGDRLTYAIEVDPAIGEARLPPMMLLPLIDHAIAHGLEPAQAAGASLRVVAEIGGGRLHLVVATSGTGFVLEAVGDSIASIRERLFALYGAEARLELSGGPMQSAQALVEIPFEHVQPGAARDVAGDKLVPAAP
jgi:hypothetical protein